ncbi:MAG: hypothetical protein H7Y27_15935 [Gemmatimonadaceae bacterium]|nr:hypothetical protein [Chitinophagaceae bacterium]
MKEILQQYAAYNVWANKRLSDATLKLPEEFHTKPVVCSFEHLHGTVLHLWDAESIWWQRMKLQEVVTMPSLNFKGNTRDVFNALIHQNMLWQNWVNASTEAGLTHVFQYYNSKREYFKQPLYQALMQVFNHATYHRGQIVSILKSFGQEQIPATDFIVFTRSKKSGF